MDLTGCQLRILVLHLVPTGPLQLEGLEMEPAGLHPDALLYTSASFSALTSLCQKLGELLPLLPDLPVSNHLEVSCPVLLWLWQLLIPRPLLASNLTVSTGYCLPLLILFPALFSTVLWCLITVIRLMPVSLLFLF